MIDRYALMPILAAAGIRPQIDYYRYLQSASWRRRADACKKRAGYRCQICNRKNDLEAHHRTYERLGHERADDLTCLCAWCHELFSRNGRIPR